METDSSAHDVSTGLSPHCQLYAKALALHYVKPKNALENVKGARHANKPAYGVLGKVSL